MTAPTGMILAAGLGTRMRPLTLERPKPMISLAGRALIDYPLRAMAAAGVGHVVVNLHHLGDQLREFLGNGQRWGVELRFSEEPVLQGSGGGLRTARHLLGDSTIVAMNGDTVVGIDLGPYIDEHRARGALATLILRKDPEMDRFGTIAVDREGRVQRFLDHRVSSVTEQGDPYMFTGVQILEPGIFEYMPESGPFSITEITYPRLLAAGEAVYGAAFDGPWLTVGTADELVRAEAEIAQRPFDWPGWMGLS